MELNRKAEESVNQYIWRMGSAKDAGLISYSWAELAEIMNQNIYEDEADYLGESAYRKRYSNARDMYQDVFSKESSDSELLREIKKERKKLETEKFEYNKWLREDARDELIAEKIENAIRSLEPMKAPEPIEERYDLNDFLLVISDAHYGVEFQIDGLHGETLNEYSPEIFEYRMELLASKIHSIIDTEGITKLNIWDLSDSIEGILRTSSQLMKLRYGIIDSSIKYAEYLSNWLNDLSMYVNIDFQMCMHGNHSELRILGAPKGSFPEENMAKIILEFIKLRLAGNPNITITENKTGYCYGFFQGFSVLGLHGNDAQFGNCIDSFSKLYDTPIDYTVCGHKHHSASKEVGQNREEIVVRSIMGTDPYAVKLSKASNPGASLLMFEEDNGLAREYKLKL